MKSKKTEKNSYGFFGNLSLYFVDRPRFTATLMIAVIGFGFLSYTTFIRREGFPPVDIPISIIQGRYFADDASLVDKQVAAPLTESVAEVPRVEAVMTTSFDNSFFLIATLSSGTGGEVKEEIQSVIDNTVLPEQAQLTIPDFDAAKYFGKYDIILSIYSTQDASTHELEDKAQFVADTFMELDLVGVSSVESLFREGISPQTGESVVEQVAFAKVGVRETPEAEVTYYNSIAIGLSGHTGEMLDIFEMGSEVDDKIAELNEELGDGYMLTISADNRTSVAGQISSLQSNVVSALIAILIVSALIITWRVSVLMAIFVVSVLSITVGVLYLLGSTLNSLTLFGLVLALGLFVDDATIISEAIAARKKKYKGVRDVIGHAVSSVGSASFAGTFTTILVFAPLLFITGILGEFIVVLPATIIVALLVSLILSLILIPFLSQFTILTKKSVSLKPSNSPLLWVGNAVIWTGNGLANMIRKVKTNKKIGIPYALVMFSLSIVFILGSGQFASKLGFNIFPPTKDADQILVVIDYDDGTDIEGAQVISKSVDSVVATSVGSDLVAVNYGGSNLPNTDSAMLIVDLTHFQDRELKSPVIIESLENDLEDAQIIGADFSVSQFGIGPSKDDFPFAVQIFNEDPRITQTAAADVEAYLADLEITLTSGEVIRVIRTDQSNPEQITRKDGRMFVTVSAGYSSDDTSQLVQLTRTELKNEYTHERLEAIGLSGEIEQDLGFDFGQESENEESFAALGPAGLVALGAMFILLLVQFRSVLKPLLIFLAIPFSFLGVTAGLYYTDNVLSFFVMIGFIGLIGIAVNNTILLVDAANRFKKKGDSTVEAIADGLQERFRPLVTTTTTTMVALAPLAISDPFWEPLAVTIMFGLFSSTILVVLSFPMYYIAVDAVAVGTKRTLKKLFKKQ